jgi:hypothetical protein
MKTTKSLWRVSVITTPEAEDAVSELLGAVFAQPVSSYFNLETGVTMVTVYLQQKFMNLGAPASRRRVSSSCSEQDAGETPALPGSVTCHFSFAPWTRVQIISPETGREVADGETGLIRVFDLANVFSVMAIQTEDLGIRRGDGFELTGRATLAEPRGCSLMSA